MTQQETQQKAVISWLKDAHALEVGAFSTLEDHSAAAEAYPEMQGKLREHLGQTHHHAELIAGCLERLGARPAAFKETVSSALGKVTGVANLPAKDTTVKNALGDYAAENFEIACYVSLIAGAEQLGDQETADTCRQILQDEEDMAGWLKGYIPTLTEQYLARVADMPDVQDTLKQTSQNLSSKGKEAASGIDTKNTLLASGAILAGAGAALLVGQALRGKSDKDNQDRATVQTDRQDLGTAEFGAEDGLTGDTLVDDTSAGDTYDGYVTEVEVESVVQEPLAASLLEPELATVDDPNNDLNGYQDDVLLPELQDADVELVSTEVWLTPGPYTGIGPKTGVGAGDATEQEVRSRLTQHGQIDASAVEITVDGGEVLLEGTVDSEETKRLTEEAVESVTGVTNVQSLLQVSATQA